MIDAVSRDVHEDMNIAMRAGRIANRGEGRDIRPPHRVYKKEEK